MTDPVISTHHLTKRFGSVLAVDDVSLTVLDGDRYGFLGPNGSGKTTTIRMLLGLVFPTSGSHTLLGGDFVVSGADALSRVGALVEGPAFHPYLSGRANLARLDAAAPFSAGFPNDFIASTEQWVLGAAADVDPR